MYSYCIVLSSDQAQPNWKDLAVYARLIPRVCYVFGKVVREPATTPFSLFLGS